MSEQNGVNGTSKQHGVVWKVGLVNYSNNKYLTHEIGGINILGKELKVKQKWSLEQLSAAERDEKEKGDQVFIKNHKNQFLKADKFHELKAVDDFEDDCRFVLEYPAANSKFTGCWLFRNASHGTYLGAKGDGATCYEKTPSGKEHWIVQLCMHPQVNIRNEGRQNFAHLQDDELQCKEKIPWGADALVVLEFNEGKYAIKTSNNKYLKKDGSLEDTPTESSLYNMEIKTNQEKDGLKTVGLAFKDKDNQYMIATGATATMRTGKSKNPKDELFTIQDSHPQVVLISSANKMASIRQALHVSANQEGEEYTDMETFQLEFQGADKWAIRSSHDSLWTLVQGGGIESKSKEIKPECLFTIEWQGDGTVAFKASNGKYVYHKPAGALMAIGDHALSEDETKFKMRIINRPLLVLRCQHGFVGRKSDTSVYSCNRAKYEIIFLEGRKDGKYTLKDSSGKYWTVTDDTDIDTEAATADSASAFVIEFRGDSKISIKAPNGKYLTGEQNGFFRAKATDIADSSLWEF